MDFFLSLDEFHDIQVLQGQHAAQPFLDLAYRALDAGGRVLVGYNFTNAPREIYNVFTTREQFDAYLHRRNQAQA